MKVGERRRQAFVRAVVRESPNRRYIWYAARYAAREVRSTRKKYKLSGRHTRRHLLHGVTQA